MPGRRRAMGDAMAVQGATSPAETEPTIDAVPWHALSADETLSRLGACPGGLSGPDAAARLARSGPNLLPSKPPAPWWLVFARQFASPLILVLALAAGLALAIGEPLDSGFIAVVLVLNALIGGTQEWRAERSAQALRRLLRFRAAVERDGRVLEVEARDVVPGDILWLESGGRVPADARLLTQTGLQVDESLLTGESLPVAKDSAWTGPPETPLADRRNMVHAGAAVVHGRAKAVITATGPRSSAGRLALDVAGAPAGSTPLLIRLERFSKLIGVASLFAAALVVLIGVLGHGRGVGEMTLFGIALAVAVIPEGLPVAITVALAVASSRMAKRGVIVRRLDAVEGLGSCTMIASDKTGTLTCNELTVREVRTAGGLVLDVFGEGFEPSGEVRPRDAAWTPKARAEAESLALAAVLCNEGDLHATDGAWTWRGDPTDVALLSLARKLGVEREPALETHAEVNRIPFEPEHRFAATFHDAEDATRVFVKGAPERVLAMCETSANERAGARASAEEMATRGLRVLALAAGVVPDAPDPAAAPAQPDGLRLLGFVGMLDPLRPGVREAVASCARAGVHVSMVTGDHPTTALAIARDLGLASKPDQVVTGEAFDAMTDDELGRAIGRVRVFARVAPHQKLRIVEAAKAAGHFVAVTGDGANDAPALRSANIGVAMGKGGTDVARDASDLVISDDNFATIVSGIEEGRIAYDNVRKVVYLLLSTGIAEAIMTIIAVGAGMPLPLLPAQLLWLNLVTNGVQDVALGFEPGERDVLDRPPRPPRERLLNRLMLERSLVAALVMGLVSTAAFWWMLERGWGEAEARNALLLLMVLFENVHMGNCRSETRSAFARSPLRSPVLLGGTIGAMLVHLLGMHVPALQAVLRTEPLGPEAWATLFALALSVLAASEIHKLTWRWRRG